MSIEHGREIDKMGEPDGALTSHPALTLRFPSEPRRVVVHLRHVAPLCAQLIPPMVARRGGA
jgi:hypothetical protein